MPKAPRNPSPTTSQPLHQAPASSPRTRLFWVSFEDADDDQATPSTKSSEQIYQEALIDTIETLLNEQTASPPPPVPHTASQPPASAPGPSRDAPPPPSNQTPPQHAPSESQLPAASQPQPDPTDATPPARPPTRHRRHKSASSSKHQPSPTPDSPPSQQRMKVRRTLLWPNEGTQENLSNDFDK